MLSYEYCEIFKNTFFYRTPPMAASDMCKVYVKISCQLPHSTQDHYHHLTHNAFKCHSIKSHQTLIQLKTVENNTIVTKKTQGVSSILLYFFENLLTSLLGYLVYL